MAPWLSVDAPACPRGCGPIGVPVRYPWGEVIEDRWDGPAHATVKCPCCGHGWVGTDAEVEQATLSLRAYDEANGHLWPEQYRTVPSKAGASAEQLVLREVCGD